MLRAKPPIALCLLGMAGASGAQNPDAALYAVDVIARECAELAGYPVALERDDCSVVDSGPLTTVDGETFFYARYRVTAEVPFWPDLREPLPDANALVLFRGRDGEDSVRIYRTYHEDFSSFSRYHFPVPRILETSQGKVLHIERRGLGGGMQQWFNDEYWLWRPNGWQELDVAGWYPDVNAYLPLGYRVAGVSPNHFDLARLRNVSPVRRPDDPNCCPSAGIVTVSFDWVDLGLTIRSVVYDPDTDFRSLSP